MDKKQYLEWLEKMEADGLDECEIEAAIEDYLDQPESQDWFFRED